MQQINIAIEIFALIVTALLLFSCVIEKPKNGKQTFCFILMLIGNIAVLLCDLFTWIYEGQGQLDIPLRVCNFFVYSIGYVITALFTVYLASCIDEHNRHLAKVTHIISGLCAFAVLLVVISMFNGMYFTYENGIYVRGPFYWLSQVYPCVILFVDLIITFTQKKLSRREKISIVSYAVLPLLAMVIQIFVFGITLLYMATTLSMLIIYLNIYLIRGRRLQDQETQLTNANVELMLSQIQPHFLYNALTSIGRLCKTDPEKAEKVVDEFAVYLRGNLDSIRSSRKINFNQELEHVKHYIALEQVRFGDRIKVIYDIQSESFFLPTLTLQPIVENAVRHGICKRKEGGTITVTSRDTSTSHVITVADNGVGFDPKKREEDGRSHVGINNVKERLSILCNGELQVCSKAGKGTTVTIVIGK